MTRELTCICCPLGCRITINSEGDKILSVTGNTCKRGEAYAISECTHPMRTVTSTVMTDRGVPVSVKTADPIPKDKIFECMKIINGITAKTPIKTGDTIFEDVFGARLVATADSE